MQNIYYKLFLLLKYYFFLINSHKKYSIDARIKCIFNVKRFIFYTTY